MEPVEEKPQPTEKKPEQLNIPKQPMFFETTYATDYIRPASNRELALQNECEPNLPISCFSPPLSCTTPIAPPQPEASPPAPTNPPADCGTNRFLPNICHTHPDTYENLQSNAAWTEQSCRSPCKSSYQIDYDHLSEYRLGPHPEDTKYFIRECNATACSGCGCCAGGLCSCQLCHSGGVACCPGQYPDLTLDKPSKIPRSYISFSHWPERPYKDVKTTEYKHRISQLGGKILKAQIHDHQCCKSPKGCQHRFILENTNLQ